MTVESEEKKRVSRKADFKTVEKFQLSTAEEEKENWETNSHGKAFLYLGKLEMKFPDMGEIPPMVGRFLYQILISGANEIPGFCLF